MLNDILPFKKSMKFIYFLALFVMFAIILGLSSFSQNKSKANTLVWQIIKNDLLSYYFDDQLRAVGDHYTRGTKYAGKVRVNLPFREESINIYVFHYHETLPHYLKDNCTSFPKERTVLCDHRLLDSIPDSTFSSESWLMLWIVGHEIGHILLEHKQPNMLEYVRPNGKPQISIGPDDSSKLKTNIKDVLIESNEFEIQADEFAIIGLPLPTSSILAQYRTEIGNALLWERRKLVGSGGDEDNKREENDPSKNPETKGISTNLTILMRDGEHPPLILRLLHLAHQMRKTYPVLSDDLDSYLSELMGDINFNVEFIGKDVNDSSSSTDNNMFYDGLYLGSEQEERKRLQLQLDQLIAAELRNDSKYAKQLSYSVCKAKFAENEILSLLQELACIANDRPLTYKSDWTVLKNCGNLDDEKQGRCVGAIYLTGLFCEKGVLNSQVNSPICNTTNQAQKLLDELESQKPVMKVRDYNLMIWMPLAQYIYQRDVSKWDLNELHSWLKYMIAYLSKDELTPSTVSLGIELLDTHISYLKDVYGKSEANRLAHYLVSMTELQKHVENEELAITYAREAVELVDTYISRSDPLHADTRFNLGNLMAGYQVNSVSHDDSNWYVKLTKHLNGLSVSNYDIRKNGISVLNESAQVYREAYQDALLNGKSEEYIKLRVQHLQVMNAILWATLTTDPLDTNNSLDLAESLKKEINDPLYAKLNINLLRSAVFENIATANIQGQKGDASVAIEFALASLNIREVSLDGYNVGKSLITLALAYYAAHKFELAKSTALKFNELYGLVNGKTTSPETHGHIGAHIVRGEGVTMEQLMVLDHQQ